MVRFKGKYRVESVRLCGWDYGSDGWYFVTVCSRDRRCWFGDVVDGRMRLSTLGAIVAEEWRKTEEVRSNIVLDEWVVMPNHLRAILAITQDDAFSILQGPYPEHLRPGSLGSIIGQSKSVCSKRIREKGPTDFAWQRGFYDHVIRNGKALDNIRRCIAANPSRWNTDKNNPSNQPSP